ncbi:MULTISPECIES: YdeI/OmpD-associated family protein [unclassified Sphingomonas]|uniref:YdeI/OmpD-associated family protein n=1 Tax=unclassified Sphingomonas TaxID=196159 RepID=UPI000A644572|nr:MULTISPECIES: YdeI/OmpD-associated family protein [unclassified Sphingomonas]
MPLLSGIGFGYLQVMNVPEADALVFESSNDLADWLAEYHADRGELWVRIYKAGSQQRSVTWNDCVIEAIRFGWIDGLKRPGDERSYLQRLTPRRAGSSWSTKNREHADRLIAEGLMTPAGLAHVEAARTDGRWDAAYEGSATMVIPQDFLDALATLPEAEAFFRTLDRKNLYPIYHRLQTAKHLETRARRMQKILEQLSRGERFH